jgi:chromosome segregation ATPase
MEFDLSARPAAARPLQFIPPAQTELSPEEKAAIDAELQRECDIQFEEWKLTAVAVDAATISARQAELDRIKAKGQADLAELQRQVEENREKRRQREEEERRFTAENTRLQAEVDEMKREIARIMEEKRAQAEDYERRVTQRKAELREELAEADRRLAEAQARRGRLEQERNEASVQARLSEERRGSDSPAIAKANETLDQLMSTNSYSVFSLVKCLEHELNAVNELRTKDRLPLFGGPMVDGKIEFSDEDVRGLIMEPGQQTLKDTYRALETYYEWKVARILARSGP